MGKKLNAVVLHTLKSHGWSFVEVKGNGEVWSKFSFVLTVSQSVDHADRFTWTLENRLTGDFVFDAGVTESLCKLVVSK